ncbi:50S ribosomal protein L7ae-like protein [Laceyella sacchari]|jgi:large subunit ribosomal protein L7A|uniref:LSU ribosomal protein L7AE n=3 Tax=Laceyella TaxID=292635 RepID=A0AA45WRH4_9BACL|nr:MULTISPECIES: 50S ribosomal protein L7ae-like protein [Laceyella]AUS07624.1 50S ribosomal protein L7ae-like protein [Laceyella sacchari]MRG29001.1 50S ribosomal protein L7ae-like protein [Laceyella tengchongensis]PRZ13319.1 LSU ribosomal protein L7AE [Laceyella sediminis]TCW36673.1 LSU ribosomal protein L7AE [Laceyella sacchari]UWE03852.1 50S ribosomal protein L7ae-like protein [Laceyella sacchari]
MSYEKVIQAESLTIGTKQTKKAIEQGRALEVLVADDADPQIIYPILKLCKDRGIHVIHVESMKQLGKACGIEVGAATAAVLK